MRQQTETKKRQLHMAVYEVVQRWFTGDRAGLDDDTIELELAEAAQKQMILTELNMKTPNG